MHPAEKARWQQHQQQHRHQLHTAKLRSNTWLGRSNRSNRSNHPNRRLLRHRQSRRKLRLARRLARKQDKYQLKTWDHYVGEA